MVCVPAWVSQMLTPDWLTAIGTVAAVVVALFLALYGKHIERRQFHPVLRLRARVRRPDADKVSRWRRSGDSIVVEGESWYFRLAITNEGNDAAREVQVFLARVERKHGHKTQEVSRFTPMNLKWTNTDDEQISRDRVTRPVLLADTPDVYCDLVHINDPSIRSLSGEDLDTVAPSEGVLGLDVQVPTYSKGHLLEPGTYIFYLTIAASNCDSTHYELEVSYSGKWSGDEKATFHEFKMAPPALVKRGALLAKFRSPD
jgi:hypothetical protein